MPCSPRGNCACERFFNVFHWYTCNFTALFQTLRIWKKSLPLGRIRGFTFPCSIFICLKPYIGSWISPMEFREVLYLFASSSRLPWSKTAVIFRWPPRQIFFEGFAADHFVSEEVLDFYLSKEKGERMSLKGGYRATARDKKYLRLWKEGRSIGFTMKASLKAKGLIPRANGSYRVSDKYRQTRRKKRE